MTAVPTDAELAALRRAMVEQQLRARGIADARVLAAMGELPRERFVDAEHRAQAYDDAPLPIGAGQTISQPYMVARMLELAELRETDRVLEVGAGSGYQTALLGMLVEKVYAVERIRGLGELARKRCAALGLGNVEIGIFDGTAGWPEHAPFHAIIVAAGAPTTPPLLVDQLADGGRVVIPVGPRGMQDLHIIRRSGAEFRVDKDTACSFVDLVGRYGWGGPGAGRA